MFQHAKVLFLWLLPILMVGCASNSGVVPIGQDTFMVSRQAATGFSGTGTLKSEAFQEANKYCADQGKKLQVVSTNESQPPYVMANFPRAEIQFMCLNSNDAELGRPKLQKTPNTIIEVKQNEGSSKVNVDVYTELKKYKELLDTGVITQSEFDAQKAKILNK